MEATRDRLLTLSVADIDQLPWREVTGCPGVRAKELWHHGALVHALIAYAPGASTPGIPHPHADHYIWVVSGEAKVAGDRITAGSYLHVPPGVAHPIGDIGDGGCVLLQLHVSHPTAAGRHP
jgi:quercetin dioxygenase-like cupin family protein